MIQDVKKVPHTTLLDNCPITKYISSEYVNFRLLEDILSMKEAATDLKEKLKNLLAILGCQPRKVDSREGGQLRTKKLKVNHALFKTQRNG